MTAKVIELIDVQMLQLQQILNVYHYVDPAGTGDEATLVEDYIAQVLPALQNMQSNGVTHTAIRYRQVYPTAELVQETTEGLPIVGALTSGDDLPSFFAASFKWNLGSTVILSGGFTGHIKRSGTRICGVKEGDAFADHFSSTYLTNAAVYRTRVLNPNSGAFELCVASFLNGARQRQHTVQAYALINTGSDPSPSTQNTRKYLRGRSS